MAETTAPPFAPRPLSFGSIACLALRFAATLPTCQTPQPRIAFRLLRMLTRSGYPPPTGSNPTSAARGTSGALGREVNAAGQAATYEDAARGPNLRWVLLC